MKIFGRHHVRSTFYHSGAIVFIIATALWFAGIMDDKTSLIITMTIFIVDYIAEMFDPHPDNHGPWFRSHFHRFFDGDDGDDYEKCEFTEIVKNHSKESAEYFKKNKSENI